MRTHTSGSCVHAGGGVDRTVRACRLMTGGSDVAPFMGPLVHACQPPRRLKQVGDWTTRARGGSLRCTTHGTTTKSTYLSPSSAGRNALVLSGENDITVIWHINTEYKYKMNAT